MDSPLIIPLAGFAVVVVIVAILTWRRFATWRWRPTSGCGSRRWSTSARCANWNWSWNK